MNFSFSEEQEELRATARAFLAEHSKPEQVRAAMESELGHGSTFLFTLPRVPESVPEPQKV